MKSDNKTKSVDRRKFISSTIFAGFGIILPQKALSNASKKISSVVVVEDKNATEGVHINAVTVQEMIDDGIMALTGSKEVGEAWKAILPEITSSSIIAIKVDCRSELLFTHPEITYAVCKGLTQMLFDEQVFLENNIHIYDNGKAYLKEVGYVINNSKEGVQCYMETNFASEIYNVEGTSQRVCSLVHDKAEYLINIGVLKNHESFCGVSLCMENHLGTIDSPREMQKKSGNPQIGALNAIEPIKNKQVLNILDCLLGAEQGGPFGAPTFVENKIIMSADPVAVDYLGRKILIEKECYTIKKSGHIDSAVDYEIGTNNPNLIDVVYVNKLPATSGAPTDIEKEIIKNHPNPFIYESYFDFSLEEEAEVNLDIYSSMDIQVINLASGMFPKGNHSISWKGENNRGRRVSRGLYIAKFKAGNNIKTLNINLK